MYNISIQTLIEDLNVLLDILEEHGYTKVPDYKTMGDLPYDHQYVHWYWDKYLKESHCYPGWVRTRLNDQLFYFKEPKIRNHIKYIRNKIEDSWI